jgi:hypothetical protein
MNEDIVELSSQQKQRILETWNSSDPPPSLYDLIQSAGYKGLDGRSKEGRAVKTFLASRDLRARPAQEYQKRSIKLTKEQEEYVDNNKHMMNSMEIARIVFKDPELTQLNAETRCISDYIKENTDDAGTLYESPDEAVISEYKPPRTFDKMLAKVNKYVHEGIDKDKITGKQKKDINAGIAYLLTYRFLYQINTYTSITDRELFESSFVRYVHDKCDLSQEEVDQYIVLSIEVVIAANIQRRVEHLQGLLEDTANDTEGRRISMALVEAISTAQTEYNQCVNRQQKLLDSLKQKRSDRLKNQIQENASIINLVELWKEEESRKKMIRLAEHRKSQVKKEIQSLSEMEDIKAKILGISEDEVLNG